ncbi:unnamed protein product [Amoebophrya sp. A120]|nr:unnamed protein product [Amoebophrya sp. A120]|eukprot:GSA120T00010795001.1
MKLWNGLFSNDPPGPGYEEDSEQDKEVCETHWQWERPYPESGPYSTNQFEELNTAGTTYDQLYYRGDGTNPNVYDCTGTTAPSDQHADDHSQSQADNRENSRDEPCPGGAMDWLRSLIGLGMTSNAANDAAAAAAASSSEESVKNNPEQFWKAQRKKHPEWEATARLVKNYGLQFPPAEVDEAHKLQRLQFQLQSPSPRERFLAQTESWQRTSSTEFFPGGPTGARNVSMPGMFRSKHSYRDAIIPFDDKEQQQKDTSAGVESETLTSKSKSLSPPRYNYYSWKKVGGESLHLKPTVRDVATSHICTSRTRVEKPTNSRSELRPIDAIEAPLMLSQDLDLQRVSVRPAHPPSFFGDVLLNSAPADERNSNDHLSDSESRARSKGLTPPWIRAPAVSPPRLSTKDLQAEAYGRMSSKANTVTLIPNNYSANTEDEDLSYRSVLHPGYAMSRQLPTARCYTTRTSRSPAPRPTRLPPTNVVGEAVPVGVLPFSSDVAGKIKPDLGDQQEGSVEQHQTANIAAAAFIPKGGKTEDLQQEALVQRPVEEVVETVATSDQPSAVLASAPGAQLIPAGPEHQPLSASFLFSASPIGTPRQVVLDHGFAAPQLLVGELQAGTISSPEDCSTSSPNTSKPTPAASTFAPYTPSARPVGFLPGAVLRHAETDDARFEVRKLSPPMQTRGTALVQPGEKTKSALAVTKKRIEAAAEEEPSRFRLSITHTQVPNLDDIRAAVSKEATLETLTKKLAEAAVRDSAAEKSLRGLGSSSTRMMRVSGVEDHASSADSRNNFAVAAHIAVQTDISIAPGGQRMDRKTLDGRSTWLQQLAKGGNKDGISGTHETIIMDYEEERVPVYGEKPNRLKSTSSAAALPARASRTSGMNTDLSSSFAAAAEVEDQRAAFGAARETSAGINLEYKVPSMFTPSPTLAQERQSFVRAQAGAQEPVEKVASDSTLTKQMKVVPLSPPQQPTKAASVLAASASRKQASEQDMITGSLALGASSPRVLRSTDGRLTDSQPSTALPKGVSSEDAFFGAQRRDPTRVLAASATSTAGSALGEMQMRKEPITKVLSSSSPPAAGRQEYVDAPVGALSALSNKPEKKYSRAQEFLRDLRGPGATIEDTDTSAAEDEVVKPETKKSSGAALFPSTSLPVQQPASSGRPTPSASVSRQTSAVAKQDPMSPALVVVTSVTEEDRFTSSHRLQSTSQFKDRGTSPPPPTGVVTDTGKKQSGVRDFFTASAPPSPPDMRRPGTTVGNGNKDQQKAPALDSAKTTSPQIEQTVYQERGAAASLRVPKLRSGSSQERDTTAPAPIENNNVTTPRRLQTTARYSLRGDATASLDVAGASIGQESLKSSRGSDVPKSEVANKPIEKKPTIMPASDSDFPRAKQFLQQVRPGARAIDESESSSSTSEDAHGLRAPSLQVQSIDYARAQRDAEKERAQIYRSGFVPTATKPKGSTATEDTTSNRKQAEERIPFVTPIEKDHEVSSSSSDNMVAEVLAKMNLPASRFASPASLIQQPRRTSKKDDRSTLLLEDSVERKAEKPKQKPARQAPSTDSSSEEVVVAGTRPASSSARSSPSRATKPVAATSTAQKFLKNKSQVVGSDSSSDMEPVEQVVARQENRSTKSKSQPPPKKSFAASQFVFKKPQSSTSGNSSAEERPASEKQQRDSSVRKRSSPEQRPSEKKPFVPAQLFKKSLVVTDSSSSEERPGVNDAVPDSRFRSQTMPPKKPLVSPQLLKIAPDFERKLQQPATMGRLLSTRASRVATGTKVSERTNMSSASKNSATFSVSGASTQLDPPPREEFLRAAQKKSGNKFSQRKQEIISIIEEHKSKARINLGLATPPRAITPSRDTTLRATEVWSPRITLSLPGVNINDTRNSGRALSLQPPVVASLTTTSAMARTSNMSSAAVEKPSYAFPGLTTPSVLKVTRDHQSGRGETTLRRAGVLDTARITGVVGVESSLAEQEKVDLKVLSPQAHMMRQFLSTPRAPSPAPVNTRNEENKRSSSKQERSSFSINVEPQSAAAAAAPTSSLTTLESGFEEPVATASLIASEVGDEEQEPRAKASSSQPKKQTSQPPVVVERLDTKVMPTNKQMTPPQLTAPVVQPVQLPSSRDKNVGGGTSSDDVASASGSSDTSRFEMETKIGETTANKQARAEAGKDKRSGVSTQQQPSTLSYHKWVQQQGIKPLSTNLLQMGTATPISTRTVSTPRSTNVDVAASRRVASLDPVDPIGELPREHTTMVKDVATDLQERKKKSTTSTPDREQDSYSKSTPQRVLAPPSVRTTSAKGGMRTASRSVTPPAVVTTPPGSVTPLKSTPRKASKKRAALSDVLQQVDAQLREDEQKEKRSGSWKRTLRGKSSSSSVVKSSPSPRRATGESHENKVSTAVFPRKKKKSFRPSSKKKTIRGKGRAGASRGDTSTRPLATSRSPSVRVSSPETRNKDHIRSELRELSAQERLLTHTASSRKRDRSAHSENSEVSMVSGIRLPSSPDRSRSATPRGRRGVTSRSLTPATSKRASLSPVVRVRSRGAANEEEDLTADLRLVRPPGAPGGAAAMIPPSRQIFSSARTTSRQTAAPRTATSTTRGRSRRTPAVVDFRVEEVEAAAAGGEQRPSLKRKSKLRAASRSPARSLPIQSPVDLGTERYPLRQLLGTTQASTGKMNLEDVDFDTTSIEVDSSIQQEPPSVTTPQLSPRLMELSMPKQVAGAGATKSPLSSPGRSPKIKPAFGSNKPTSAQTRQQKASKYYARVARTPEAVKNHKERNTEFNAEDDSGLYSKPSVKVVRNLSAPPLRAASSSQRMGHQSEQPLYPVSVRSRDDAASGSVTTSPGGSVTASQSRRPASAQARSRGGEEQQRVVIQPMDVVPDHVVVKQRTMTDTMYRETAPAGPISILRRKTSRGSSEETTDRTKRSNTTTRGGTSQADVERSRPSRSSYEDLRDSKDTTSSSEIDLRRPPSKKTSSSKTSRGGTASIERTVRIGGSEEQILTPRGSSLTRPGRSSSPGNKRRGEEQTAVGRVARSSTPRGRSTAAPSQTLQGDVYVDTSSKASRNVSRFPAPVEERMDITSASRGSGSSEKRGTGADLEGRPGTTTTPQTSKKSTTTLLDEPADTTTRMNAATTDVVERQAPVSGTRRSSSKSKDSIGASQDSAPPVDDKGQQPPKKSSSSKKASMSTSTTEALVLDPAEEATLTIPQKVERLKSLAEERARRKTLEEEQRRQSQEKQELAAALKGSAESRVGDAEKLARVSDKMVGAGNQNIFADINDRLSAASTSGSSGSTTPTSAQQPASSEPSPPPFSEVVRKSRQAAAAAHSQKPNRPPGLQQVVEKPAPTKTPARPSNVSASSNTPARRPLTKDEMYEQLMRKWQSQRTNKTVAVVDTGNLDDVAREDQDEQRPEELQLGIFDDPQNTDFDLVFSTQTRQTQSSEERKTAISTKTLEQPSPDKNSYDVVTNGEDFLQQLPAEEQPAEQQYTPSVAAPEAATSTSALQRVLQDPAMRRFSQLMQAIEEAEESGNLADAEALLPLLEEAQNQIAQKILDSDDIVEENRESVKQAVRSSAVELNQLLFDAQSLEENLRKFNSTTLEVEPFRGSLDDLGARAALLQDEVEGLAQRVDGGGRRSGLVEEELLLPSSSSTTRSSAAMATPINQVEEKPAAKPKAKVMFQSAGKITSRGSIFKRTATQKRMQLIGDRTGTLADGLQEALKRRTTRVGKSEFRMTERGEKVMEEGEVVPTRSYAAGMSGASSASSGGAEQTSTTSPSFLYYNSTTSESSSSDDEDYYPSTFDDEEEQDGYNSVFTCRSSRQGSGYCTALEVEDEERNDVAEPVSLSSDIGAAHSSHSKYRYTLNILCENEHQQGVSSELASSSSSASSSFDDELGSLVPQFGVFSMDTSVDDEDERGSTGTVEQEALNHLEDSLVFSFSPMEDADCGAACSVLQQRQEVEEGDTATARDEEQEAQLVQQKKQPFLFSETSATEILTNIPGGGGRRSPPTSIATTEPVPVPRGGPLPAREPETRTPSTQHTNLPPDSAQQPRKSLGEMLTEVNGLHAFYELPQSQRWSMVQAHLQTTPKAASLVTLLHKKDIAAGRGNKRMSDRLSVFMQCSHTPSAQNLSESMRLARGTKAPFFAETVARSSNPEFQRRLEAYLTHSLATHSTSHVTDQEQRILLGDLLIDDKMAPLLREVFERYCNLGDRVNTEWMSNKKWIKLLLDARLLVAEKPTVNVVAGNSFGNTNSSSSTSTPRSPREAPGSSSKAGGKEGRNNKAVTTVAPVPASTNTGLLTIAEADLIHAKVITTCDPGLLRLSFDLFCKALAILSLRLAAALMQKTESDLRAHDRTSALQQPSPTAATASSVYSKKITSTMLDRTMQRIFRNVLLHCYPKSEYATSCVPDDSLRLNEVDVEVLLHFKDFLITLFVAFTSRNKEEKLRTNCGAGVKNQALGLRKRAERVAVCDAVMNSEDYNVLEDEEDQDEEGIVHNTTSTRRSRKTVASTSLKEKLVRKMVTGVAKIRNDTDQNMYKMNTYSITDGLANGEVQVKDRRNKMDFQQFLNCMKALGVYPALLERPQVLMQYKAATGCRSELALLNRPRFLEAVALTGIHAFSRPPYSFEYANTTERLYGFLTRLKERNALYPKRPIAAAFSTSVFQDSRKVQVVHHIESLRSND